MEVEIPGASPFTCNSRRDPFQNNLDKLDIIDLWVHQPQWQAGSTSAAAGSAITKPDDETSPCDDKPKDSWARAREIVFPTNTTPPKHPTSVDVSNSGGVSSLVQKWKGFEAAVAKRPPPPPPPPGASAVVFDDDSVIGDWESDRTVLSGRSSIRGRDSDATESERLRVVDIIRKLTPNEAGSVSPPRSRSSLDLPPPVPGPRLRTSLDQPRIRGRQAYVDLLMQAERERRNELQRLVTRKPVSTFSHRGRIQAALKIKLLRRGMETKESHHHFRERVDKKHQNTPIHSRNNSRESILNSNSLHQNHNGPNKTNSQDSIPTSKEQEIYHTCFEEFKIRQENNWESSSIKCAETEAAAAAAAAAESHKKDEEGGKVASYGDHHIVEIETAAYWASDASHTEEGWEEFHYDDDQTNEANNTDWIEMVSRPRSDWEYLRQERYQEMLDPFVDNDDIRQLLGRKSVSNFLSSGMRYKIDQLMISRTQGKPTTPNNQRQDKRQEKQKAESRTREPEECFHEYEEAESSQHYTECDDFTDSTSASWSQNPNQGVHEPCESSYQAASRHHQDINRKQEMDLVYDLRSHMEQLHQEISELRKSVQCSNDMQMKLHRSIKKELINHLSGSKSGRRHPLRKTNGRRCCVCRKVEVDCVLYRCGHMCTCFVCAHELHWNSGSCPICRATIVDVILTHSN